MPLKAALINATETAKSEHVQIPACSDSERLRTEFLMPLLALLGACFALLPFYQYELGPDAISYLSIAREYSRGYYRDAINAYWSPLFSWLIAVLTSSGMGELIAAKFVSILGGALSLWGVYRLSMRLALQRRTRRALLWTACVVVIGFVAQANTPDLLFTGFILVYLSFILNSQYPNRAMNGIFAGLIAGISFLAKSYGLAFFLVHFSFFHLFWWWIRRYEHKILVRLSVNFLAGVAVFTAICLSWTLALHSKYGRWTTGTSGEYNVRLVGPESEGFPHLWRLLAPGAVRAANAWEDPSPSSLPPWNLSPNPKRLRHQGRVIYANTKFLTNFWLHSVPLAGMAIVVFLVLALNGFNGTRNGVALLFSAGVFAAGYILISVEERYVWGTNLMVLCFTFLVLEELLRQNGLMHSTKRWLQILTVMSFALAPLLALKDHFLVQRDLFGTVRLIKRAVPLEGGLAACGNWSHSAYVAYFLETPFYGLIAPDSEAEEVAHQLNPDYKGTSGAGKRVEQTARIEEEAAIKYLLLWPSCTAYQNLGKSFVKANDMQIVKVKE